MLLIGITGEDNIPHEIEFIELMLHEGIDYVHLRKPHILSNDLDYILSKLPSELHSRIILHDHFELSKKYTLGGLHINRRNTVIPPNFTGHISRSCHSIEELQSGHNYYYQFLSPIYDSISKSGYKSSFTKEELTLNSQNNTINNRVIALGGITPDKMPEIKEWGFGGVALLGSLWNCISSAQLKQVIQSFVQYKK